MNRGQSILDYVHYQGQEQSVPHFECKYDDYLNAVIRDNRIRNYDFIAIGDSHTFVFNHITNCLGIKISSSLLYSVTDPNSQVSRALASMLDKIRSVTLAPIGIMFGEIDCRMHLRRRECWTGKQSAALVDKMVKEYCSVISSLRKTFGNILVIQPPIFPAEQMAVFMPEFGSATSPEKIRQYWFELDRQLARSCLDFDVPYFRYCATDDQDTSGFDFDVRTGHVGLSTNKPLAKALSSFLESKERSARGEIRFDLLKRLGGGYAKVRHGLGASEYLSIYPVNFSAGGAYFVIDDLIIYSKENASEITFAHFLPICSFVCLTFKEPEKSESICLRTVELTVRGESYSGLKRFSVNIGSFSKIKFPTKVELISIKLQSNSEFAYESRLGVEIG